MNIKSIQKVNKNQKNNYLNTKTAVNQRKDGRQKPKKVFSKKSANTFSIRQKRKDLNFILKKAWKTRNSILYLHSQYGSTARSYKIRENSSVGRAQPCQG